MPRSPLTLLRSLARHTLVAVALLAVVVSVLRIPTLALADHAGDQSAFGQNLDLAAADCNEPIGTTECDGCGSCHGPSWTCGVVPDAMHWASRYDAGQRWARPAGSRMPDGPAAAPDVPPDQI
jgi:hypothetical protein